MTFRRRGENRFSFDAKAAFAEPETAFSAAIEPMGKGMIISQKFPAPTVWNRV